VDAFEGPTHFSDLSVEVRERIEGAEPLLLTCTLREMIVQRQSLVEDILRARRQGSETIFLPCENAPHSTYTRLIEVAGETGATALRTVVNRMCTEGERDSQNRRMVSAHSLGEWLIERPPHASPMLEQLEASREVKRIDDYDSRQARKLWMVNGAHQALALMAWEGTERTLEVIDEGEGQARRSDDLRDAARGARVLGRLSHLHAAMDDALVNTYPNLEGNLEYGLEHVVAYSEHPDSVKRVLGAFRRQDLTPFIKTMEIRLGRPAEVCALLKRSLAPFAYVFDVLENLCLSLDAFLDVKEIRTNPDLIDPATDERALQAYGKLLRGWMSAGEAEERVQRLAGALASHR
jgi:hypothetical protein